MSDDESILGDALCDLTIELDDGLTDIECTPLTPSSSHLAPIIGPPRRPSDVVTFVSQSIIVHSLSPEAKAIVINQMQLPAYSSMKNGEALGAAMGFGQDELMSQSRQGGIICSLMHQIWNRPVNDLLKALVTISRVDTLSSLRPFLMEMRTLPSPTPNQSLHTISSTSTISLISTRQNTERLQQLVEERRNFILLVHYEKDKAENKTWKHFLKNMKAKGDEMKVGIVDVNELLNGDEHFIRRLQQLYSAANLVVICVSKGYGEVVGRIVRKDQIDDMIATIHDWVMGEHMNNGQQNKRFRIVLMGEGCDSSDLPLGWAASFLWYRFPSNWASIVDRTFQSIV